MKNASPWSRGSAGVPRYGAGAPTRDEEKPLTPSSPAEPAPSLPKGAYRRADPAVAEFDDGETTAATAPTDSVRANVSRETYVSSADLCIALRKRHIRQKPARAKHNFANRPVSRPPGTQTAGLPARAAPVRCVPRCPARRARQTAHLISASSAEIRWAFGSRRRPLRQAQGRLSIRCFGPTRDEGFLPERPIPPRVEGRPICRCRNRGRSRPARPRPPACR